MEWTSSRMVPFCNPVSTDGSVMLIAGYALVKEGFGKPLVTGIQNTMRILLMPP